MYKHIIWDFDGTLFDTYPVMATLFMESLKSEGIDEPLDEIVKHMKVSMSYALRYYEKKDHIDQEFIRKYKSRRKAVEAELSKPFDGVLDICTYIHSTDRKNYLYTHRGESALQMMATHGLVDYFSGFITSQQGFERKPSPDAILYLVEKYSMVPSETIMIGDRDIDVLSAKNAGISACYFAQGHGENSIADYTITGFEPLYALI